MTRSLRPHLAAAGLALALGAASYPAVADSDEGAHARGPVVSDPPRAFAKAASGPRTSIRGCGETAVVSTALRVRRPARVLALASGAWSGGRARAGVISVALVDASGIEVAGGVHTLGSPRRRSAMTGPVSPATHRPRHRPRRRRLLGARGARRRPAGPSPSRLIAARPSRPDRPVPGESPDRVARATSAPPAHTETPRRTSGTAESRPRRRPEPPLP